MIERFYNAATYIFAILSVIALLMLFGTIGAVDCGMEFPYWQVVLILSTVLFLLCLIGYDCATRAYNDCLAENIEENERTDEHVGVKS